MASALNLEGTFTGTFTLTRTAALHGYVRAANGNITEYNVNGAGTGSGQGTEGSSISDLGTTAGNYIDSSGVNHGFLRGPSGDITTFNVSAAGTGSGQGTVPEGIDLWGGVTGQYVDSSNVNHGFVRSSVRRHHHLRRSGGGNGRRPGHPSGDPQRVWGDHRTVY